MEKDLKLYDAEYRFACIVWDNEPIRSGELTKLCQEELGWKRTTTYTVLKKLCNKGLMQNEDAIVTSLVKREEVQRYESRAVMGKIFEGSLPRFIAAFLEDQKLTEAEAEQIRDMIDRHRQGKEAEG